MNILVCGFMGAGKSTFCKRLNLEEGWRFIELDEFIEHEESMTIPDIFDSKGELYFRERELVVITELLKRDKQLISLGGGALSEGVFRVLDSSKSKLVFLDTPFETCLERISGDPNRPLSRKSVRELRELYENRLANYQKADLRLFVERADSLETITELIKII